MSSIYKKGRDGFYYYQAYVQNPETKKKDKRIYKALGTKDYLEAKKQQGKLDSKYLNKEDKSTKKSFIQKKIKLNPILLITIIFISILFGYSLFRDSSPQLNLNYVESNILKEASNDTIVDKKADLTISQNSEIENLGDENLITSKAVTIQESNQISNQNLFPNYSIVSIDSNQKAFNQIKINLTIDKATGRESQLMLCDSMSKKFSLFSNLIICLYSSDSTGIMMANENDSKLNSTEKKESWLAMYTYNEIEGRYFNDDPTGYLAPHK